MLKILLATGNAHKAGELLQILPAATAGGRGVKYFTLADFPQVSEPAEDGATLAANAIIKARAGLAATGLLTIADDTGLMVAALGGAPGVHSARYAHPERADYAANNTKLLRELRVMLTPKQRAARFCTVAALAKPNGEVITKEGFVDGYIAQDYRGQNGFGYDPLFVVSALGKTMAELNSQEKNKISHRAMAFAQMADIIKNL